MNKIGNMIKGVVLGIILFFGSFIFLFWNEGNNAKNMATAIYMEKNAVQIKPDEIQDANNGLLVAVTGKATTEATLQDSNIKLPKTLVLTRTVEMYQWDEVQNKTSSNSVQYEYKKRWSSIRINSESFHNKTHRNPEFPLKSTSFYAISAKLGAFDLTNDQIRKITPKEYKNLPESRRYTIENGKYYSGVNIDEPEIGDILISYKYAPSGTSISIIGQQNLKKIIPFEYKNRNNYVQYNGSLSKSEIIRKYKDHNHFMTIFYRIMGWILMFFGLQLLSQPLNMLFSFIPFFGQAINSFTGFILLMVSLALSLITIAIAWIAYRPVFSIILIIISIGIAMWVKQMSANKEF